MVRSTIQRFGRATKPLIRSERLTISIFQMRQDAGQCDAKDRPFIGAVGERLLEVGKQAEQRRQQGKPAIAILNVGGSDDAVQQQSLRVDQNVPLLALDQLARIKAGRIAARHPFSAFFTL